MKRCYSLALLPTIVLLLAIMCLSQSRQITQEQFYDGLHAGFEAAEKIFPRRETNTEEELKDGKVTSAETKISEFQSADILRVVTKSTYQGVTDTTEMIQIGNSYFCKENGGKWKKGKRGCDRMSISALPEAEKMSFSVENITESGESRFFFHQYRTHRWETSRTNITTEYFYEDKFWLRSDLAILRREMTSGEAASKEILSKKIEVYEYDLELPKIEAPVKSVQPKSSKRTTRK